MLTNVKSVGNKGCRMHGFHATKRWDLVARLGTLDFKALAWQLCSNRQLLQRAGPGAANKLNEAEMRECAKVHCGCVSMRVCSHTFNKGSRTSQAPLKTVDSQGEVGDDYYGYPTNNERSPSIMVAADFLGLLRSLATVNIMMFNSRAAAFLEPSPFSQQVFEIQFKFRFGVDSPGTRWL